MHLRWQTIIARSAVVILVLTLASCGLVPPSPKLELVSAGPPVTQEHGRQVVLHDLKHSPFTVAEARGSVQAYKLIPFNVSEVPKTPKLDILMTVVTYACAIKPGLPQGQTRVLVNQTPVAQWSFAYEDQGKTYRTLIDIDPKLLKIGENRLEVVGERCSLGNFEVVRFNGIALAM